MPFRNVPLISGHYYHIYNRGVNRQPIFFCAENWAYFIYLMRSHFTPEIVEVTAYCLMPNHYHLLVYLKTDDFSRQVMQPFSVAYSKAINSQSGRSGPLFDGRFRSILINKDAYLLQLSRYIHRNPVEAGLVLAPEEWAFSSYRDYIGDRQGSLAHPNIILSCFDSRLAYREFVNEQPAYSVEVKGLLLDNTP